jgi:uncharacterized protein (TIGR00725 family)
MIQIERAFIFFTTIKIKLMQFEIHLTVETNDIEKFKSDCQKFGCKPIMIETQRNQEFGTQVMTSDKYTGYSYERMLIKTVSNFQGAGYKILREKVEIFPQAQRHLDHMYYESHIRLTLPKDLPSYKLRQLKNHCISDNWYYSKNLFKSSPEVNYQMITLRMYDSTYEKFSKAVEKMEFILETVLQLTFDKVEIEECVHDTNALIDKSWIKPPTATFFGGGKSMETPTMEYLESIEIGRFLAQKGYQVKNGGYGGLMEAVSKGITDEGGKAIGYTFKPYPATGNSFLTESVHCENLYERLEKLISNTDIFIVQKGGIGTLAELFLTLDICRKMKNPPMIVLFGSYWLTIMAPINPLLGDKEFSLYEIVTSVEELDIYFHDKQEISINRASQ